jgi:hypothetical protein
MNKFKVGQLIKYTSSVNEIEGFEGYGIVLKIFPKPAIRIQQLYLIYTLKAVQMNSKSYKLWYVYEEEIKLL